MQSRALPVALSKTLVRTSTKALMNPPTNKYKMTQNPSCDVFINHRSIDTKRTVAGLLYYDLAHQGLSPFLDSKNMKPGDNLYAKIDAGIRSCKLGVAVFSPRYCESKFCLHELALLYESKKRVIPIFCDVKPSELGVTGNLVNGTCSDSDLERYKAALEEAKVTVGLTFDCAKGDWPEFLQVALDVIMENLIEIEEEEENDSTSYVSYNIPNETQN